MFLIIVIIVFALALRQSQTRSHSLRILWHLTPIVKMNEVYQRIEKCLKDVDDK